MNAIYKKEMRAYFTTPIAYIVICVIFFFSGISFYWTFQSGAGMGTADIPGIFSSIFIFLLIVIPLLAMRLFADEKRQKSDQLLLTSPVKLISIVMGKYLAALTVFACSLSILFIFQLIYAALVTPDWLKFISNLLGILLLGGALIAITLFVSSLTESQAVAAIGGIGISLFLFVMDMFQSSMPFPWMRTALGAISFQQRYQSFCNGIVDYANIIFFASIAFIFLFLTLRILDMKRWA